MAIILTAMPPELIEEAENLFSFPVIAGVITWFVSQIIIIILAINHKPKNRKVEEAVRRGHVVKAYIVGRVKKLNRPEENKKGRLSFSCNYEYTVNGKKMIYKYHAYTMPPSPLTLYYINNPKKVFPGDDINTYWRDMAGLRYAVIFVIPIFFAVSIMFLLGGVSV